MAVDIFISLLYNIDITKRAQEGKTMNKNLDTMINKAVDMMASKLGCHWLNSKADFTFGNGKVATVERTCGGQKLKLTFEGEVLYEGTEMNNHRTVAYDLIVLGYENK